MPELTMRAYRPGDAGRVPVAEADPFEGWLEAVERDALGLTSYDLDGQLVAVSYYMPMWDGVAEGAALIDRQRAAGHGRELAKLIRLRIDQLMEQDHLHRVQATSEPHDRASQVFLRAIGYHYESTMRQGAPDRSDLLVYVMLGRQP